MPFVKGHRLGVGRHFSQENKERLSKLKKGIPLSLEVRKKMSDARKGKAPWNKGKPHLKVRGENHPNWQGGLTSKNKVIRKSIEYRLWRESVFKRDDWTCVWCGKHGGNLEADHIKPFALFPELRFALDNGRTLCRPCHILTFRKYY